MNVTVSGTSPDWGETDKDVVVMLMLAAARPVPAAEDRTALYVPALAYVCDWEPELEIEAVVPSPKLSVLPSEELHENDTVSGEAPERGEAVSDATDEVTDTVGAATLAVPPGVVTVKTGVNEPAV